MLNKGVQHDRQEMPVVKRQFPIKFVFMVKYC